MPAWLGRYRWVWLIGSATLWGAACGESEHDPESGAGHAGSSAAGTHAAGSAGKGAAGRPGSAGDAGRANGGSSGSRATGGDAGASAASNPGGSGPDTGGTAGHSAGGASGEAGSANGAASGQGGESGESGESGGGQGGMSTPACQAHAASNPSMPAPTSMNADLVARAAVITGSCMPDDGVNRNATHFWNSRLSAAQPWFRFATQLDCLASAACGCGAVEECLSWYVGPARGACETGCDGSSWSQCISNSTSTAFEWNVDCSTLGLTCDETAGCVDGPATPCSVPPYEAVCTQDGRRQSCDNDVLKETPACSSLGFACSDGMCTGSGATCDSAYSQSVYEDRIVLRGTSCAGDTLTVCENDREGSVDCTTQGPGFSCQSAGEKFFCGLASECSPADDGQDDSSVVESCDGTVLTFCNAGRIEHLDCTTLGFTGCDIDHSLGHYGCTPVPADELF